MSEKKGGCGPYRVTLTASPSTNLQPGQLVDVTLPVLNNRPGAIAFASVSTQVLERCGFNLLEHVQGGDHSQKVVSRLKKVWRISLFWNGYFPCAN
jgi:hypothetical protein